VWLCIAERGISCYCQRCHETKAITLVQGMNVSCIGLARTVYVYGVSQFFWQGNHQYTVIYGVYIRFWPTLVVQRPHKNGWG